MTTLYQLITVYNDCTSKCETADLSSCLRALAIYWEEPNFFLAHIVNVKTGEVEGTFKK